MTPEFELKVSEFWRRIDVAAELARDERIETLEKIISELRILLNGNSNSILWYIIGYAWYIHPERLTSRAAQAEVEAAFRSAIKIDPCGAHAWLYLGHHYYDLGEIDKAADCFRNTDPAGLPEYLRLKLLEMHTCCSIRSDGIARSMSQIKSFVAEVEKHPKEDIMPRNLYEAIKDASGKEWIEADERGRIARLLSRIDELGAFERWFSEVLS